MLQHYLFPAGCLLDFKRTFDLILSHLAFKKITAEFFALWADHFHLRTYINYTISPSGRENDSCGRIMQYDAK